MDFTGAGTRAGLQALGRKEKRGVVRKPARLHGPLLFVCNPALPAHGSSDQRAGPDGFRAGDHKHDLSLIVRCTVAPERPCGRQTPLPRPMPDFVSQNRIAGCLGQFGPDLPWSQALIQRLRSVVLQTLACDAVRGGCDIS